MHAPQLRAGTVDRHELLERLGAFRGSVLVVGPPGFGKTTLLGQWQRFGDRPFAWLSLDTADNDPVLFWSYITWAIRTIEPAFGLGVEAAFRVPGTDLVRAVVLGLLNELEALEIELVLVLEDYHWITNAACHESLELFLDRKPPNVTLVVSARSDPPLSFGRLRAGPGLLELRAADLSFTEEEADRFLNGTLGLGLSTEAVAELQERTEGWPAGLYLSYLSLREAADRERFVRDFSGSSRHVVDYLREVVVTALDERTREFLLRTSILERMCGPLCDFLTGRGGSAELLIRLERANLFLVPLDDRRDWYRYHRLFADLLQDELDRLEPGRAPELHRRASEWLAAAGHTGAAIRHAIAAGDLDSATRFVAEQYLRTIEWGGVATVAGWLEAFPRTVVTADARLAIVEAWVMGFLNRPDEARLAIQSALRVGYEGPLPDGASSVEASAALLRAGFPWGDVGEMLAAARRAFELEGGRDSMWRVTVHVQLGWSLSLAGEFDEARPLLESAAAQAPLTEQWLNALGAECLLAWIALEDGRFGEAERWARDALGVVESHGLSETPPGGWAYATLGAVLAGTGRADEADRLLGRGLEQMRGGAQPLLLIQALLAFAPVRRTLGASGEARALLAEARTLVDECRDPGVFGVRLEELSRSISPAYRRISPEKPLTERELEVLHLLEKGLSQREIAQTLYLSYNTVHSHTRTIYRKLGAISRAEAIDRAHDQGLL